MVSLDRRFNTNVLLLAMPLLLAGCGGGEPPDADGCFTEKITVSAKSKQYGQQLARPKIDTLKEKIDKKFKDGVKYHDPVVECTKYEKNKKPINPDPVIAKKEAEEAAKKAKEAAKKGKKVRESKQLVCEFTIRYCPKPPPEKTP